MNARTGKSVLVVDDRAVNREFLTTLLRYKGYRLFEAEDGAQALALAVANPPDAVITDILMPTMDGYEFVRQLRATPGLADTVVIFYTAHYRGPEAERLAAACGVRHVLTKPCDPQIILDTLEQALGNEPAPSPLETQEFDRAHLQLVTDKLSGNVDELRRTSERLQALILINLPLASERDPQRLLDSVCQAARDLVGAKYALLAVGDKNSALPLIANRWFTSGMERSVSEGIEAPALTTGEPGEALRTRSPRRHANPSGVAADAGLPASHPPVHALLVAPIVSLSRSYGWIALSDKVGTDAFSEDDERLLGILCAQLGRTYENGSLLRELETSEAQYRTIFENSVLGIFAVNASQQVVSVNPALARMLGYDAAHPLITGPDCPADFAYVDKLDRIRFATTLRDTGVATDFETQWRCRDGSVLWVSLSARVVGNLNVAGINQIGLVEDITERVRLRDAVREREAGLRHAEQMAKLAHVVTGPDGIWESWSDALPRLVGRSLEDLPRSTREWLKILHPDDRAAFRAAAIDATKRRERNSVQYRVLHPDGSLIHLRQEMEPLDETPTDARSRWFNTLQDVTEQKRSEERITRLNRVYAVLSAINSAIVRLHERGELFAEACRIAVIDGEFKLAWIGEVDPQTQEGKIVAWHGSDQAFIDRIRFSGSPDSAVRDRPASRAIREMKPFVAGDLATEPTMLGVRDDLVTRDHGSLAVFPLIVGGHVEAVLSLHAREKGFFDDEEMVLLTELAGDVAFALEYIAKAQKLDYLAYYDALTGLPNSTLFRDRLAQMISPAGSNRRGVALYLVDLDNFTNVNDSLGRHAGDKLLAQVAVRLRDTLPPSTNLSRISGDTFAVAIGDLDATAAASADVLEDHLFATMRETFVVDGHELRMSARVGIAQFPGDGEDADTLFKNAEAALRQAKASTDRYMFYAPAMNARMAEKLALESQLRLAVEVGQFVLHYQPKVDLSTGSVVGSEALLRWQHPDRGLLMPGQFLSIVEESESVFAIGDWVMTTACMQLRQWHDGGLPSISVAVNVSARQFWEDALLARVTNALAKSGIDPALLEIELTEDIVMQDATRFIDKLTALKKLGVKLSLDDFGTGYSSLSYLKRFPLDSLKVDQSFIREVTTNPDDAAIVRAIISVGHSLGLNVVAEGVESEAQVEWLRRERCEEIQGFFFSRPIPAMQFEQLVRSRRRLPRPREADANESRTLLIVDDEANILAALVRLLRKDGYRILTAQSAAEGLNLLALNVVHVIVSDHRMPVMTGAEFFGKVKALYPDTVRILFSGYIEMEALTDAVNRGAVYRFLLKPWDDEALRENVRQAFHYYWLTHKQPPHAMPGDPSAVTDR